MQLLHRQLRSLGRGVFTEDLCSLYKEKYDVVIPKTMMRKIIKDAMATHCCVVSGGKNERIFWEKECWCAQ